MAEAKKARYTGPITLGEVVDEAPVKKDTGIDLTQFKALLQQSYDKREAKNPTPGFGMNVPDAQVSVVKARFRTAAKEMGIGLAVEEIKPDSDKGKTAGVPGGHVRLVIEARKKKAPRKASDTASSNGGSAAPAAKKSAGLPAPAGARK